MTTPIAKPLFRNRTSREIRMLLVKKQECVAQMAYLEEMRGGQFPRLDLLTSVDIRAVAYQRQHSYLYVLERAMLFYARKQIERSKHDDTA